ncbi:hypothetical protein ACCC88_02270 [Sphingomonas sp. Sphisp140]|uniref:hypothetical protein n=1 Tax=unclassified Sphingomonas TaxID=196159 RepID=UPI0039AF220A
MATSAPASPSSPAAPATPSQPPVEILYAAPVGTVLFWYPPPTAFKTNPNDQNGPLVLVFPPGFVLCDGQLVSDKDSPFDGTRLPSLIDRFILGAGTIPYGNAGGYSVNGWQNGSFGTGSTTSSSADNQSPGIIQDNAPHTDWRYNLTKNGDGKNDGNHHHTIGDGAFTVPLPPYLTLIPIMRIK